MNIKVFGLFTIVILHYVIGYTTENYIAHSTLERKIRLVILNLFINFLGLSTSLASPHHQILHGKIAFIEQFAIENEYNINGVCDRMYVCLCCAREGMSVQRDKCATECSAYEYRESLFEVWMDILLVHMFSHLKLNCIFLFIYLMIL